ncbi:hypothetical protein [Pedobacter sp. UC225_65]|uniref:hypothetical protein n=1 Tax=Pedobacter sp. UC225_65 TaxID=3350173 RepID=UPI00366F9A4D
MKKANLLSKSEMKKVMGGVVPPTGLCHAYCRDKDMNSLNPNQVLIVASCDVSLTDCKKAYSATDSAGCWCSSGEEV